MWSDGLMPWYARHGRHHLPWRTTRDPWAILVSEVMLQQTSVARVLPRWERFLDRWPSPAALAAEPLEVVLREWDGLGYPRRAQALWRTAGLVADGGWPAGEAGLRGLPGVGPYTARALLAFALGGCGTPPRDVNLARVGARAALGLEPHQAGAAGIDAALARGRPRGTPLRDYSFALFDVGATLCRARSAACAACPLHACRSRARMAADGPPPGPRRQPRYQGSLRQLRGAVLRELVGAAPPHTAGELAERVSGVPAAARPGALEEALGGLADDGLIPAGWRPVAP